MANSNFSLGTMTFTAATQVAADAKRDQALLDFCKAHNLAVYEADGVTPNQALVVSETRAKVREFCVESVKGYRAGQASSAAHAAEMAKSVDNGA